MKIRQALLGRKHTTKRCQNMSAARKGKPWTEARRIAQEQRGGVLFLG